MQRHQKLHAVHTEQGKNAFAGSDALASDPRIFVRPWSWQRRQTPTMPEPEKSTASLPKMCPGRQAPTAQALARTGEVAEWKLQAQHPSELLWLLFLWGAVMQLPWAGWFSQAAILAIPAVPATGLFVLDRLAWSLRAAPLGASGIRRTCAVSSRAPFHLIISLSVSARLAAALKRS